jgi:hypothetical protein
MKLPCKKRYLLITALVLVVIFMSLGWLLSSRPLGDAPAMFWGGYQGECKWVQSYQLWKDGPRFEHVFINQYKDNLGETCSDAFDCDFGPNPGKWSCFNTIYGPNCRCR